jgi:hypothetical protein
VAVGVYLVYTPTAAGTLEKVTPIGVTFSMLPGWGWGTTMLDTRIQYLCLIGRVCVFYVGHVDKSSLYQTLFHCNTLSKHYPHH